MLQTRETRLKYHKIKTFYPDVGPLRRDLYQKHLEFFRAGKTKRARLMLSANRVGKTEYIGLYEMVLHLTGDYPVWWEGRRFNRPITAWVCGKTSETVRDVLQVKLFGSTQDMGSGVLPRDAIVRTVRSHTPEKAAMTYVRHRAGGESRLVFKSYEQGRDAYEGDKIDVILLDEEPPLPIYAECVLRTMSTTGDGQPGGLLMLTFTPLEGLSDVVLLFLPDGQLVETQEGAAQYVVMASWDDVPHLTEDEKQTLLASIPPYQRDARSKGIPQLGAGAIYPIEESRYLIEPFELPRHWPRAYAMDVGWNKTAAVWFARDMENDIIYVYSEHYQGEKEPTVHAEAIRARGEWMSGVIDPAARGRGQKDGEALMQIYQDLGLDLVAAQNAVEAGIYAVWERLEHGKLKIFKHLNNLLMEMRLYRRDEKGRVVKSRDHLVDALRYGILSGLDVAKPSPVERPKEIVQYTTNSLSTAWMQ